MGIDGDLFTVFCVTRVWMGMPYLPTLFNELDVFA